MSSLYCPGSLSTCCCVGLHVAMHAGYICYCWEFILKVWYAATIHVSQAAQSKSWGGLWTATDAESFAANAVHLYTYEDEWQMCQERGFELLESLYSKADRLKIVQVLMYMSINHVSVFFCCTSSCFSFMYMPVCIYGS